jgi:hypothetical protein
MKVKVTISNLLVPAERIVNNKQDTSEISKSYYILFKRYRQGKSFQYVGQTPRLRSQGQFFSTHEKVLPQRNLMWNVKALVPTNQKI